MSWPATPKTLRVIASYDTRSAFEVCDQIEILGNPVVTMDEPWILLTA